MAEENHKVKYSATSDFKDLGKDLDSLLGKIEAVEAAQKRVNKNDPTKKKSGSTTGDPLAAQKRLDKASAASTDRRIKRLDAATKKTIAEDVRSDKSKSAALNRRIKKAEQAQKILNSQETRAERSKNSAQTRRNAQANQLLKSRIAEENRQERSKDASQRRRTVRELAAEKTIANLNAEKSKRQQKRINDSLRQELAKIRTADTEEAKLAGQALKQRLREEDVLHMKKISGIKTEAAEREKAARKQVVALDNQITQERDKLTDNNSQVRDGNRFTRNPVNTRNVRAKEFKYDASKDSGYFTQLAAARETELTVIKRANSEIKKDIDSRGALYGILSRLPSVTKRSGDALSSTMRRNGNDIKKSTSLLDNFSTRLDRIGRWRPRIIPPFIALIPLIASLLALMNPLVAGLGAVGAAGLGLAGSLGSLAGAALGAIPALAALLSVGAALKSAFGGVGKAFKAANKVSAGGGGGGSSAIPKEEITQVEKIQRAQEKYRRSIEDVAEATNDLDQAKKDYIKRLKDVEKQVERVRASEARANANAQLSLENYYNVMADPGSTKGQKMDALVDLDESKQDIIDVRDEAVELRKELAEMRRTGVNGDAAVKAASRSLTDAIWAQRDAQIDLANAYRDTGEAAGGAGGAADEFADAMAKLSPSARKVVETLLAMKPAWDALQLGVQEKFFSEIVNDVSKLNRLFPTLENLLGKSATAMGQLAKQGIDLVTSDKWLKDLNIVAEQNVPIIQNVGRGLLSILDALLDLTVAAGPFAIAMSEGFAAGSKNFQEMIASARESGSLANWLETVQTRLSQWWRIIKNIGGTLFNYSAAASNFGTWLTDGLEKVSEGWLASSKASREAGSSFQKYLEDIKPLLSEVKRLFSTFFEWFGREASNPKNIAMFTNIIQMITDELGPALADIFDVLSETGVGESLVEALITIFETIGEFLEKGGAEGIKSFFKTINNLFSTFSKLIDVMPADTLSGIAQTLMTIAALRFFGITGLITGLLGLINSGGLGKLKEMFTSMKGAGQTASPTAPSSGTVANAGKRGVKSPSIWSKAAGAAKGVGNIAKVAGPVGLAAGAAVGMAADTLPAAGKLAQGDSAGASQDLLKNQTKWAMPGVGVGIDLISMLFPTAGSDIDTFLSEMTQNITNWIAGIPGSIAGLGINIWSGLTSFNDWLVEKWEGALLWFQDLPNQIAFGVGVIWGNLQNFGDWLAEKWVDAQVWFQNLPQLIADTASDIWSRIKNFGTWLGEQWNKAVTWFQNLPQNVANAAKDIWGNIKNLGTWLGEQWNKALTWFTSLPGKVGNMLANMWNSIPSLYDWAVGAWNNAKSFFGSIPSLVANAIGNIFSGVTGSFSAGESSVRKKGFTGGIVSAQGIQRFAKGGEVQRFANGGEASIVPGVGNSDTVPAMLMPGEVIFSKPAVNRAGGAQNLLDFNAGKTSFGDMLMSSAFSGITGFANGGEVLPPTSNPANNTAGGNTTDNRIIIENLEINNPTGVTTSDSVAQTVRDLTYMRG